MQKPVSMVHYDFGTLFDMEFGQIQKTYVIAEFTCTLPISPYPWVDEDTRKTSVDILIHCAQMIMQVEKLQL